MKLAAAISVLALVTLAAFASRPPKKCDPYAEKCPACVDCTACHACNVEKNRCSVCRDKK